MTIFKENIVDTSLIGPILTALLAAAGFYCKFWFTRYQASRDQAQKVSRAIEDVLSKMAALFGQKKPARILREEFSAVIAPLHQEMRILDDMTSRLPLKWLQREQRHVLYHARWLQRYLDSRRGGKQRYDDFLSVVHFRKVVYSNKVGSIRNGNAVITLCFYKSDFNFYWLT